MQRPQKDPQCGIIFDLDGTLLDSLSGIAKAINRVLTQQGWPIHSTDTYRMMVGEGVEMLISRALPKAERNPKRIREFVARYRQAYDEIWPGETDAFPDIPDLLHHLTQQEIPYCVLSNKTHEVTCRMVSQLLPQFPFVDVLGQRDEAPCKPEPGTSLTLSLLMRTYRHNTILVGDSAIDMKTAKNAGMMAVGVSWGMRTVQELRDNGAEVILDHPLELLTFIAEKIQPSRS